MQATVLFADLSGSSKLCEAAGQAAGLTAIAHCIERMKAAAEAAGGQVVQTLGDQIMATFPNPDAAAAAAAKMHAEIEALPPVNGAKLSVHAAFHTGPVIQRNREVMGDTVKFASRLLEEAQRGQTVTSKETAAQLGPEYRAVSRQQPIKFRGGDQALQPCDVLSRSAADAQAPAGAQVRLTFRGQVLACSRENESVVIGRDHGCGLVVTDRMASRRHCTIERRGEQFVLQDHSSNGTYITLAGERGILLKEEHLPLTRSGTISFGHRRFEDSEAVEFYCVVGL